MFLEKERKKDIENSCAYRQQGAYRGHYHQKSKFPFQGVRFFHFIYPQGKFLYYKFIIGKAFDTCNQFSPKKAKKAEIFMAFRLNIGYTDIVLGTRAGFLYDSILIMPLFFCTLLK